MKKRMVILAIVLFKPFVAFGYADCWTPFFNPGDYLVAYDSSGIRYIGGLPAGTTCNCTVSTSQIWISAVNGEKKGTTSAVLAASFAGKNVQVYIQDLSSDGYCRSQILRIQPN